MLIESDIVEKFIHSGGNGGQNVNKVATCVYLRHIPTGIEVKCQVYRTQAANRTYARKLLEEKVTEYHSNIQKEFVNQVEKIKRANRRKPKILKEKILKDKKHRGEIKSNRKKLRY